LIQEKNKIRGILCTESIKQGKKYEMDVNMKKRKKMEVKKWRL
jgi:hypothetical protein